MDPKYLSATVDPNAIAETLEALAKDRRFALVGWELIDGQLTVQVKPTPYLVNIQVDVSVGAPTVTLLPPICRTCGAELPTESVRGGLTIHPHECKRGFEFL